MRRISLAGKCVEEPSLGHSWHRRNWHPLPRKMAIWEGSTRNGFWKNGYPLGCDCRTQRGQGVGWSTQTGLATRSKEPSTKCEALQFCPLRQEQFAELLLNYRLQVRVGGCKGAVPNANKTREYRSARIGQVELANRCFKPLHLSGF